MKNLGKKVYSKHMSQIFIFGDSITFGQWDKEGGWAERLKNDLSSRSITSNQENYYEVHNLGVPGDTTQDLLERFEGEYLARRDENEETVFVFAVGINDSALLTKDKTNSISKEAFRRNIKELADCAQKHSVKLLFAGLTPVDETKTNPWGLLRQKAYLNSEIEEYNRILIEFCEENGLPFADTFDKFRTDCKDCLEDGLHPNSQGHEYIFERVRKKLEEVKII